MEFRNILAYLGRFLDNVSKVTKWIKNIENCQKVNKNSGKYSAKCRRMSVETCICRIMCNNVKKYLKYCRDYLIYQIFCCNI